MKRLIPSLTIVFCLLALLPAASPVSAKDNWISVRSKNFFLLGNASEKEVKQVATRLEQFREVFSRLFPKAVFNTPVPTTVIVFKNDSSYRPFKPRPNTAGYFQSGPDVNYITLTTELRGDQDAFSVIFHEFTHLLVNNTMGNMPAWFNEGLAEYYSTFSISDDRKVVLGKPISSHVYLLREKKLLPLRTLFQVDHQSPYYNEKDKQSVFYAESWALMHYLVLGKDGQRLTQMGKFVELLTSNVPMEQAFQQAFAMSFESMEKELQQYVKNDRYPIISGHFEQKVGFDNEMQVAPISEAESQAYLGDLLLHSNRADAEGYLQKALTLDPNLGMAHASMGMLRVRQGKADEARQSLERAVAVNSQNYLIHYYYAYALSREGQDGMTFSHGFAPENVARMREELRKAIELRPDFPESYGLLAFINLVTGTQLDESAQMLKRALSISPGRSDLILMLAQVYMGKQDYKTARELLQKLTDNNADAQLRKSAQTLLAQVVSIEEQNAQFLEAKKARESESNLGPILREPNNADREIEKARSMDPSFYLRDALKKPEAGETQVQGILSKIDCDTGGLTFVVKIGDRLVKLKSASFDDVDLTSFSPDAGTEITCGVRKPENHVVVIYVPSTDARARVDGVAKSIEFVPGDFKLNPNP